LQENAEFIAAQPRNRVFGTNSRLQNASDVFEQSVAGLMPAGVVDELELIEIQI
jgi:hypothetical protein